MPVFAFRLHQFITSGGNVHASLGSDKDRYITLHGLKVVPGYSDRPLLPLVFCRECGQEYYSVWRENDEQGIGSYTPRDYTDRKGEENNEAGFL